ncbi:hypothetical protein MKW92_014505 [Papaver armeniacum]|nr:hypothetical protein MKW92_014505 [Papaver armeniacum]
MFSGELPDKLSSNLEMLDLSCNSFEGNIPENIGLLKLVSSLNMSHNHFSGDIPESIGNMSALESLDLSSNKLSGRIPQSLATIDSLEVLNLSYNNLSGRIPRGIHFDTLSLDGFAYAGNDLLCGFPKDKLCQGDHNASLTDVKPTNEVDEVDAKENLKLYASVVLGAVVGFFGLFCVLLLKKENWWNPYWRFVESVAVRITSYIF